MTSSESVKMVEQCVGLLPGIRKASFRRNDEKMVINATIECFELQGFDALARCGAGANASVTLGNTKAVSFRFLGKVTGLECHVDFDDSDGERPSACEVFGFYAAILLYNESILDDEQLDELETSWNANFGRGTK